MKDMFYYFCLSNVSHIKQPLSVVFKNRKKKKKKTNFLLDLLFLINMMNHKAKNLPEGLEKFIFISFKNYVIKCL